MVSKTLCLKDPIICPQGANLSYLRRHMDKLMGMADDKSLRRELASFPLASSAPDTIAAEDRPGLIPVLVNMMWPRLRKRSGKQAKKGPAGSCRTAVLHFLAGMEPSELRHLVQLVLHPVTAAMRGGPEGPVPEASHVTYAEPRCVVLLPLALPCHSVNNECWKLLIFVCSYALVGCHSLR